MAIYPLLNERELLSGIAERDPYAFKVVYEHYYEPIFKFAFRLLKSEALAEEVIQESMLSIWLMGPKLNTISNFEAFIRTIARRRAIDLLRINEQALSIDKDFLSDPLYYESTNDEAALLESARLALEQGIELLPEQQRLVYKLCYQQGLKYQEVADRLGLSHGTVQTHMKLALKFLRGYLREHAQVAALVVIFKLL